MARLKHVVAIPYPAQGHINPALQLCLQLTSSGTCETITFINTQHNHLRILQAHGSVIAETENGDGEAHAAIMSYYKDRGIQFVSIHGGLPPELHGFKSGATQAYQASYQLQQPCEHLLSHLPHFDCILSDAFLGWAQQSASSFNVPLICFCPASAAAMCALLYFSDMVILRGVTQRGTDDNVISDIPGLPPLERKYLPDVFDDEGKLKPHYRDLLLKDLVRLPETASCLLVNTFVELEGDVVRALSARLPTYCVGPILPAHYHANTGKMERRASLFNEDHSCLKWLDKQQTSSVMYISFGSISVRTTEQMEELAFSVRASNVPFLWVVRPTCDWGHGDGGKYSHDSVRQILDDCVREDRGMVIAWAPQLQVLSHPAVGGFLTHCGWNSVVESVSMGVPMLCWADTGERSCNQWFICEEWKCGMPVTKDCSWSRSSMSSSKDKPMVVGREELERTIKAFMGPNGCQFRARAAQLRVAAMDAYNCNPSTVDGALDLALQLHRDVCQDEGSLPFQVGRSFKLGDKEF